MEYARLKDIEKVLDDRLKVLTITEATPILEGMLAKKIRPLEDISELRSNGSFLLELRRVPTSIRDLILLYLPEENIDAWLQDKEAYEGQSPLEILSELDMGRLYLNVFKIQRTIEEVVAFASVQPLPSTSHLVYSVRLAQYEQINSK